MLCKLADKAHFRYPQVLCVSSLWCTQAPSSIRHCIQKIVNPILQFFQPWTLVGDMNMYILTEGRNFKTFLKENYVIPWDSCYLFILKVRKC